MAGPDLTGRARVATPPPEPVPLPVPVLAEALAMRHAALSAALDLWGARDDSQVQPGVTRAGHESIAQIDACCSTCTRPGSGWTFFALHAADMGRCVPVRRASSGSAACVDRFVSVATVRDCLACHRR
jgi:hypothetical protein